MQLRRKWWIWAIAGVLLVVVGCGTWISVRALQVKSNLEASVPLVSNLKTQILDQDMKSAKATLAEVTPRVREARELTSDPIWRAAELIPFMGENLSAVRKLATVADSIVADAVPPLIEVVDTMSAGGLKPVDGALNIGLLNEAIPKISEATAVIDAAAVTIGTIDTSVTVAQVSEATDTMSGLLSSLTPALRTAEEVLPLLPSILGSEGARNYLILFQNNAEARALGGIPGSLLLLTIDQGKISLGEQAGGLDFPTYGGSIIPSPDGVDELYRKAFGTSILNSTVRPSFDSAALIAKSMWQDRFGTAIDGVISIDPVALGYVLRSTGPIPLPSGDELTAENAASLLMNEIYQRYPGVTERQREQQDAFFGSVVNATFGKVMQGDLDPKVLAQAITQAATERRVMVWSAHENETVQLKNAKIDGALPVSDSTTDRLGVYFQDAIGSKMDYYLTQAITLSQGSCRPDGHETYRVSVDMKNNAPLDVEKALSFYIVGDGKVTTPGNIRLDLMFYAPPGSTIAGATVDGAPVAIEPLHDKDYPVARLNTTFAPGARSNISVDVVAAQPGHRALEAAVTPLVHPTGITPAALDCSTVAAE